MSGTRAPEASGRRGDVLVDAAFGAILCALALLGFRTVFVGLSWLVPAAVGLAIGAGAALAALGLRLPVAFVIGVAALAGIALSGVAALPQTALGGLVPTGATLAAFGDGAVAGWRDLVTTLPPVGGGHDHLRVVPYLCGIVGGLATLTVAGRLHRPAAAAPAPVLLLAGVILLGTGTPASLLAQGGGFAAVTLLWMALRHRRGTDVVRAGHGRIARGLGALGLLVVAGGGGLLLGPVLPGAAANDRYTVRDHVVPPFDPSAYPSPLAGYRKYELLTKDTVLFSVRGLPTGARIRIATMDAYDGVVWGVASGHGRATDASGAFARVGARIPTVERGATTSVTVTVHGFADVWLPDVGAVIAVHFAGSRAEQLESSFRYNEATDVAVVPAGLHDGDSYTLDVVVPAAPATDALAGRPAATVNLPALTGVPDKVNSSAQSWTTGAAGAADRVADLVAKLRAGAFSDGSDPATPSRPGHGAGRISDFLNAAQLVGDGEQYAATLALLARSLGLPARVVLGVAPGAAPNGEVTGKDISAWVEVDFDGLGWVPFDPTPPRDNKPDQQQQQPQPDSGAQLKQPPPPAVQPPAQLPPPDLNDHSRGTDSSHRQHWRLPGWAAAALRYAGPPLALALAAIAALTGTKRLRRHRRRVRGAPWQRITGGWQEAVERCADLGLSAPAGTRRENSRQLSTGLPEPVAARLQLLAHTADAAGFAPEQPADEHARDYWRDVDAVLAAVARSRSRRRRWLAPVNPVSLRPRLPLATAAGPKPLFRREVPAR